jgi:glycosyltransferase involved in cell wall biosynthesis
MEMASLRNGLSFFASRRQRERDNTTMLKAQLGAFQPDAVVVWGMWNLSWVLPALAEKLLPGRVVYYIGDYWPSLPPQYLNYWQAPAQSWLTYLPKLLLSIPAQFMLAREKRPTLQFAHALFCTHFLQDALQQQGVRFGQTAVIHGAIDTSLYQKATGKATANKSPSLLYVGRLREDKGVHTAVAAMDLLVNEQNLDLHLRIVGAGEPSYERRLRQMVIQANLESHVTFVGVVPKKDLPQVYRQHDAVLFTSIWQEPFGRVPVEAMAAGVPVVGACSGGAAEILHDGHNALTFPPGDAIALSERIRQLIISPALRQTLAEGGQETAVRYFDVQRMANQISGYLADILSS